MVIEIKMRAITMDEVLDLSKFIDEHYGDHELTVFSLPEEESIVSSGADRYKNIQ